MQKFYNLEDKCRCIIVRIVYGVFSERNEVTMACEMMGLTNWALKIKSRFRLRAVVSLELLGLSNLQFLLIARNTHVEGTLKIFHRSNQGNSKETDLYNDECSAQ